MTYICSTGSLYMAPLSPVRCTRFVLADVPAMLMAGKEIIQQSDGRIGFALRAWTAPQT